MTSVVPEGQFIDGWTREGTGDVSPVCVWVTGVGILNRPPPAVPFLPLILYSFFPLFQPVPLSLYPALAIDVVRSAFHALLIAAFPVAVGWFVTNRFLHPPRQMKDQEDEKDSRPEKSQQYAQTARPIQADSPLELTDLALSFSHSSEHEIAVLPSLPRVPLPPKRVSRKLLRPSTASILDERRDLLPTSSSSSSPTDNSPIGTPATENNSSGLRTSPDLLPGGSVTGDKLNAEFGIPLPDIIVGSALVYDHGRSLAGVLFLLVGIRPTAELGRNSTDRLQEASLYPHSPQMDDTHSDVMSAADRTALEPTYDWSTFIKAYADGKWDPQRTPQFPRSTLSHPTHQSKQTPQSCSIVQATPSSTDPQPTQPVGGDTSAQSPPDTRNKLTQTPPNSTTPPPSSTSTPPKSHITDPRTSKPERAQSLNVNVSHRLRKSFADLRLSSGNNLVNPDDHPHQPLTPDVLATAAAIRWAGARISVAPLALPSPEHELTDPMRGVNAAIPGVRPAQGPLTPERESGLMSPGRRLRLASFWEGTVEGALPTVDGSPSTELTHLEEAETNVTEDSSSASLSVIPPASAPLMASVGSETGDYFGDGHLPQMSSTCELPTVDSVSSVPAVTRRICLTRQTSSPLPAFSDRTVQHHRTVRSSSESSGFGPRSVKEETMFYELGYLAAPNPPDEIERRRALCRFGDSLDLEMDAFLTPFLGSTSGIQGQIPASSGSHTSSNWFSIPRSS